MPCHAMQDYFFNNYDNGEIRDYMQPPPPYSDPPSTSPYPYWTPTAPIVR